MEAKETMSVIYENIDKFVIPIEVIAVEKIGQETYISLDYYGNCVRKSIKDFIYERDKNFKDILKDTIDVIKRLKNK